MARPKNRQLSSAQTTIVLGPAATAALDKRVADGEGRSRSEVVRRLVTEVPPLPEIARIAETLRELRDAPRVDRSEVDRLGLMVENLMDRVCLLEDAARRARGDDRGFGPGDREEASR